MKTIRIAVSGAQTLPLDALEPFQGDLKHIEKTEYEKLRKLLIEMGYSLLIHVWPHEGRHFLIDGHQRVSTLKQLRDVEGFEIPALPVALVEASSLHEAKMKVLAASSPAGKMTTESLAKYAVENGIKFEEVVANFTFPDVDFGELAKIAAVDTSGSIAPPTGGKTTKSGSDGVKQLQLFYATAEYDEFVAKVEALKALYGKENISDTLLEIVREKHSALSPL